MRDDPARVRAIPWPHEGHLPAELRVIEVEPEALVLSVAQRARYADCALLQHHAASDQRHDSLRAAYRTNLAEDQMRIRSLDGDPIPLDVRDGEVMTVEFVPEGVPRG